MTDKEILRMIAVGENIRTEFKRCGNRIESDVYETVCSFSNRFGGDILCGVEDDGTIRGVPPKAAPEMVKNFINVTMNPDLFSPILYITPEIIEIEGKTVIHIHVPAGPELYSYKKKYYDRVHEADVVIKGTIPITEILIRKQSIFTEQRVFPYATINELKGDVISRCRQMAVNKFPGHPWENMSNEQLIQSAGFVNTDFTTGKTGINLAGLLLLGRDDVIRSVCPQYKTDALVRRINLDRYDDREIVDTNLVESYGILMQFARKHLNDKFHLEGVQRTSLRDKIVREMVSNALMHREFSSSFVSKFVIEKNQMFVENPCRAQNQAELTPDNFTPVSKNPIIAKFFTNIGYADELGSGTRNIFHYTMLYSGQNPRMIEDDIFRIIVPLDDNYSADYGTPIPDGKKTALPEQLSEEQKKIMRLLRENPRTTLEEISAALNVSRRTVSIRVKELQEQNHIRRVGSKKSGTWQILGNQDS